MVWYLTLEEESYERAREAFTWEIPDDYNIAYDCLRKHECPDQTALLQTTPEGGDDTYTFRDLDTKSNRLANAFKQAKIDRGDRVAVAVSQHVSNPLAHLACWKIGAISVPVSVLLGRDALRYRLEDSDVTAIVADATTDVTDHLGDLREEFPDLDVIEVRGSTIADSQTVTEFVEGHSPVCEIENTTPETPASIMYTSGSTGPAKGVVLPHSVWVGSCPSFCMEHELDVFDSVYWTPAEWAWMGAFGNVVFPAWHYGQSVVASPMGQFDPEAAYGLMETFDVTNAFIPPTALRMMVDVDTPTDRYDLSLEAIGSGGEPLTAELRNWCASALPDTVLNEVYGQTEANVFVATCHQWFDPKPGRMGKPVPGHRVTIVDAETGAEQSAGEPGQIAIHRDGDPMVFQDYWERPEETEEATNDGWLLTGDLGQRDADNQFRFRSRIDDLIITSGYRVGPSEVERAILEHSEVAHVGVVGVPDETRGEIIKAFVERANGNTSEETLREEIRDVVRERLAKYQYPRDIEFVDPLPRTSSGKIRREDLKQNERAED